MCLFSNCGSRGEDLLGMDRWPSLFTHEEAETQLGVDCCRSTSFFVCGSEGFGSGCFESRVSTEAGKGVVSVVKHLLATNLSENSKHCRWWFSDGLLTHLPASLASSNLRSALFGLLVAPEADLWCH